VFYNIQTLWAARHQGHAMEDAVAAQFRRLQQRRGDIQEHLGTLRYVGAMCIAFVLSPL